MANKHPAHHFNFLCEAIRSHNSDECLLWPFGRHTKGYGTVQFEGRTVRVHRLAFMLANGRWPMPDGCHSCDARACFNPRHIFEGTHADNNRDMLNKGRLVAAIGEHNGRAKLTLELAQQIRREYVPRSFDFGTVALGRKYGVTDVTIGKIVRGELWRLGGECR